MNSFNKERNACFGVAFLLMFMIGIYFVHIPWNIDRLNISESQLGFGIFIFGIFNFFSNQMSGRMVVPRIGTTRTIILGIIIFSGSLFLLVFTNLRWFGAITPIGGFCLIIGWLLFAYNVYFYA